jgi:heat shock protein HslJ
VTRGLWALVPLALIIGCGGNAEPELTPVLADRAAVEGRTMLSTAVVVDGVPTAVAGERHRFRRYFSHDVVSVTSGCNSGGARWEMIGGRLVVDQPIGITLMSCPAGQFEQEAWLASFVGSGPSVYAYGDEILLTGGGSTVTFIDGDWR